MDPDITAIMAKIGEIGEIPKNIKTIEESLDIILEKVKRINQQIVALTEQKTNLLNIKPRTPANTKEIANLTARIDEYKKVIAEIQKRLNLVKLDGLNIDGITELLNSINPQEPPKQKVTQEQLQRMDNIVINLLAKLKQATTDKLRNRSNPAENAKNVKNFENLLNVAIAERDAARKYAIIQKAARYAEDARDTKDASADINPKPLTTEKVGGKKLKQPSIKKLKKKSKKLKGGYLYRKQNKSSKLSSTRKSKPSKKSKIKYYNY